MAEEYVRIEMTIPKSPSMMYLTELTSYNSILEKEKCDTWEDDDPDDPYGENAMNCITASRTMSTKETLSYLRMLCPAPGTTGDDIADIRYFARNVDRNFAGEVDIRVYQGHACLYRRLSDAADSTDGPIPNVTALLVSDKSRRDDLKECLRWLYENYSDGHIREKDIKKELSVRNSVADLKVAIKAMFEKASSRTKTITA